MIPPRGQTRYKQLIKQMYAIVEINNGTITVGAPTVEGAKVTAEVVSPLVKGDKVLVFHKKRRKGYRKLNGHRQQFTELTIKGINA